MRKGRRRGQLERTARRDDADDRADAREERGYTAQITALDRRLGQGVGAVRERARLERARGAAA
jgi:hypothetical protein